MREVRSCFQEDLAFMKGFLDEFVLFVVEFEDGFLEVTDSSVDKFC